MKIDWKGCASGAAGLACAALLMSSMVAAQRRAMPRPAPVRSTPPVAKTSRAVQPRRAAQRVRSTIVDDSVEQASQGRRPQGSKRPDERSRPERSTRPDQASRPTVAGQGEIATNALLREGMANCGQPARTGDPEIDRALDFRRYRIKGQKLKKRVERVRKALQWHRTLADAQDAAAEQGKPILWIQTLGHLDSYL